MTYGTSRTRALLGHAYRGTLSASYIGCAVSNQPPSGSFSHVLRNHPGSSVDPVAALQDRWRLVRLSLRQPFLDASRPP